MVPLVVGRTSARLVYIGWPDRRASFDKLRMRRNLGGTKKDPHPDLVEGRTVLIPAWCG
jgi:hypothetical protein